METALQRIEQGLAVCPREETIPEGKTTTPETLRFLTGAQCTKEEMLKRARDCTELHFYGHGTFDQIDPLKSTLILTNGERLTLGELQEQTGELSSIRLLTLTACESGIPETEELPEEYVSLPGGFMQAGVPRVISTLWTVNERASVMLLAFFHEYYHRGSDPAEALRKAQLRLRSITYRELADLPVFSDSDAWGVQNLHSGFKKDAQKDPGGRPFERPYYWAAFTINGCLRE
jgi:CHAT domain-containing protein